MTVKQASVSVAALVGLALAAPARGQFTVTNLSPAGSFYSEARAAFGSQQAGSVITETSSNASIWDGTAESWISLSPANSEASAIFGAAGTQQVGTVSLANLNRASIWTGTAASWVDLNPLGSAESYGFATNGSQQVGYADVDGKRRASLWTGTADSWIDLEPAQSQGSTAFALSTSTQAGVAVINDQPHASLWKGAASSWIDLNPAGATESFAFAATDAHQAGKATVDNISRASLWSGTADSWIDLNPLGSIDSGVFGMHEDAQVGYAFIDNQFRASLWLGTAESWVDLNAFLPEYFTFSQAYSISSDGNTLSIVGSGFNGLTGKNEALLWTQPIPAAELGVAIAPHWDDLRTDEAGGGIFTTITGTAPNRVFHIEWRTTYYGTSGTTNFQLRLFEDNSRFELIYGAIEQLGGGATIGVQHSTGARTQYGCNAAVATNGTRLIFTCSNESIPPSGTGAVDPTTVYACGAGDLARFTVTVSPGANPPSTGLTTTANLSRIGGNAAQVFRNDGTNGDQVANDNVYTYQMTVVGGVTPGTVAIPYTVADAQGRSSSGAIPLIVEGCPSTGPDVFVVNLTDIGYYGQLNGVNAYAIGTDACNMGDVPVQWIQNTPEHPLIAQNMYRYSNGRFEQIGQ